jgi:hypothetical protein
MSRIQALRNKAAVAALSFMLHCAECLDTTELADWMKMPAAGIRPQAKRGDLI